MKVKKIKFKIWGGLELFGIVLTTRKQLEDCKISVYIKEESDEILS